MISTGEQKQKQREGPRVKKRTLLLLCFKELILRQHVLTQKRRCEKAMEYTYILEFWNLKKYVNGGILDNTELG